MSIDFRLIHNPEDAVPMKAKSDQPAYRVVEVDERNLDEYGLFCQKSKKNTEGYRNKVKWVNERFKEGLRTRLLLVNEGPKRGLTSRGFIEYIPGEHTWRGIDAKEYMVIHCIWVVGRNKGHGYGTKLLEQCESDAKGMNGVAVVTSDKHWLPRKELFLKHGFEIVDTKPPYLELLAKRFSDESPLPRFNPIDAQRLEKYASGITIFKSDQCPYTADSTKEIIEFAKEHNIPLRIENIRNCKEAQNGVHPYGTYCVLLNGKVVTYRPIGRKGINEFITEKRKFHATLLDS
jgi:GNAT superfamily N-acetyltransferase